MRLKVSAVSAQIKQPLNQYCVNFWTASRRAHDWKKHCYHHDLAPLRAQVQEEPPSCSSAQAVDPQSARRACEEMCHEQEVPRQATEAVDGVVPKNEIPPPVWTSDWSELCRARLEARLGRVSGPPPRMLVPDCQVQGYPAKAHQHRSVTFGLGLGH